MASSCGWWPWAISGERAAWAALRWTALDGSRAPCPDVHCRRGPGACRCPRPEMKFGGLDELLARIKTDIGKLCRVVLPAA